jgi:hypothetical protein
MPVPGHTAAEHRGRLLGRVRAISLGIAGGAAVATLGIGTAFAHALPGHSAQPAGPPAAQPAAPGPAAPAPPTASSPAVPSSHPRAAQARHRHARLAPPARPPAPATPTPQVVSGGS